jgi:MOSC N-terminal beta barrel domain
MPHCHGMLITPRALRRARTATLGTRCIGKGASTPVEAVMSVVGRVVALWRYPVKSMAAEELEAVEVSWNGLAGDRRWAFVRDGQVRNGFPWLTKMPGSAAPCASADCACG